MNKARPLESANAYDGHLTIASTSYDSPDFFILRKSFLRPNTLYIYRDKDKSTRPIKSTPPQFNSKGMVWEQRWAKSKDGTAVPYFLVGLKSVIDKGKAPVFLEGYGGFRSIYTHEYNPINGRVWMEKGGALAFANIRGGGEFGPLWHRAALKENRQRAYDDFFAVAQDLIEKGTTTSSKLAIYGGSNGGILVGVAITQRPELFGAVVATVPLFDMLRYHKLPPGASWIGEFGDPEKKDMRKYIRAYSPYQNIAPNKNYPPFLVITSTMDDRVHPAHARKMVAKMEQVGKGPVYYYEYTDGGHGLNANLKKSAFWKALIYQFLFKTIF